MRNFLTQLMCNITRKPRYRLEIVWSKKSWVYNIFRSYEWLFGRKYGIRAESSVKTGEGKIYYRFYTLEAFLGHIEMLVRKFFEIKWLDIKVTELQLALPNAEKSIPWISFAITLDSANNGTSGHASSLSYTHTCSGSNGILFAMPMVDTSDFLTSVTYNSVNLTLINKVKGASNNFHYLLYLANPTTGGNTLQMNNGSVTDLVMVSTSYSGASQTGIPDNSTTHTEINQTVDTSLTTVADNCWTVLAAQCNTGTLSAGSGTTIRGNKGVPFSMGMFDSNGIIHPAGNSTLEVTTSAGAAGFGTIMASFAPVGAVTNNFVPSIIIM